MSDADSIIDVFREGFRRPDAEQQDSTEQTQRYAGLQVAVLLPNFGSIIRENFMGYIFKLYANYG